ncbi:hypothetical protein CGI16_23125 [Vibrio parahaemolyticus]|uniref:hypothetical protein n=1 Tax=Vibrio parahaemolyticus TaxID=670 RepID=UPI001120FD87|nr:hypothetical protein [Vibrio parahaemolyticus]TOK32783.1 hypothetical protein CGI19_20290 [Vibrio parahaemolyticus]TOK51914.1 hypothetical protein CGI16_23125 [Vibrio parahaemolyticus]
MLKPSAATTLINDTRVAGAGSGAFHVRDLSGDSLALVYVSVNPLVATMAAKVLASIETIANPNTPSGEKCQTVEQVRLDLIQFTNRVMIQEHQEK